MAKEVKMPKNEKKENKVEYTRAYCPSSGTQEEEISVFLELDDRDEEAVLIHVLGRNFAFLLQNKKYFE